MQAQDGSHRLPVSRLFEMWVITTVMALTDIMTHDTIRFGSL
jgi:hypothetical protein